MFATGIENSYPVITGKDGKSERVDEMEKCGHYDHWREDFSLVREMGINFLRYGPPYYKTHLGPGKYDWNFADETFAELKRLDIRPIVDLCHFGVPDWIGSAQNPDWPKLFAEYAQAFAVRFPWVRMYTPVNEILINATFSALYGWWNERLRSDGAFVTALKHLCSANIRAELAILRVQPTALFIQSEATSYFHPSRPDAGLRADHANQLRFLSLDLCYGMDVRACVYEYIRDNGLTQDEYHWFLRHGHSFKGRCIMGNDYYATNESLIARSGDIQPSGEIFGYYVITRQYFDRYHLPVMHTETNNLGGLDAPNWLWKQWANMIQLRQDGVPIVGFTWYSLIDQVDWDTTLRENNGTVNPLGLYGLDRKIAPVGVEYRKLVAQWYGTLNDVPMMVRPQ
jgi:beta-glucosidase/6-phospho-beta-glucosidase/beta-galactosidase